MQVNARDLQRSAIADAGLFGKFAPRRRPHSLAPVNSAARQHQLSAIAVADNQQPAVFVQHDADAKSALAPDTPPQAAECMADCEQCAEEHLMVLCRAYA